MNDGVVQMKKKLLDKLIASFKETNKRTMENWLNELLKRSFFTERTSFPNEKNLQNTNEKFSPFFNPTRNFDFDENYKSLTSKHYAKLKQFITNFRNMVK